MRCSCHGLQGWVPVAERRTPRSAASAKRRERPPAGGPWHRRSSHPARSGSRSPSRSAHRRRSPRAPRRPPQRSAAPRSAGRGRASGSMIPNSSSSPTVKSSETSHTSRARAMSSIRSSRSTARRGGRPLDWTWHGHLGRDLEQGLRVVEDDPHAGAHEIVGHLLGGLGRHGEHADDDLVLVTTAERSSNGRTTSWSLTGVRSCAGPRRRWRRRGSRGRQRSPSRQSPARRPAPNSAMLCCPPSQDLGICESRTRRCSPPRACRTCRSPRGHGESGRVHMR